METQSNSKKLEIKVTNTTESEVIDFTFIKEMSISDNRGVVLNTSKKELNHSEEFLENLMKRSSLPPPNMVEKITYGDKLRFLYITCDNPEQLLQPLQITKSGSVDNVFLSEIDHEAYEQQTQKHMACHKFDELSLSDHSISIANVLPYAKLTFHLYFYNNN